MRTTRIIVIAASFVALGVFSLLTPRRAEAFNFFFSRGPFAISFGSGEPVAPAPIPIEPPAFYHPSASLYVNLDIPDEVVESEYVVPETEEVVTETELVEPETTYVAPAVVATPSVIVVERPRAVVYGPAYRTAPHLAAVPPAIHLAPRPAPRPAPSVMPPRPNANAYPGPYPVRPNPFKPSPYFGPGPHVPGPNHFGGMTPLGPGPRPAYGPR